MGSVPPTFGSFPSVPPAHQLRVFNMFQGWTSPDQILESDIDRWMSILLAAKEACGGRTIEVLPRDRLIEQND